MKPIVLFILPSYGVATKAAIANLYPIGAISVSAYIKQQGFTVIPLNLGMHDGKLEDILLDHITKYKINILAIGGLFSEFALVSKVVSISKKINPSLITVVGGGLVTCDPETVMQGIPQIDFGIIGEGEVTFVELLNLIENGKRYDIQHRKNGRQIKVRDDVKRYRPDS